MHILIVRNNSNPKAIDASLLLATYLSSQGISYDILDSFDTNSDRSKGIAQRAFSTQSGIAVALGGDGTILRTARLVAEWDIPLLGINFGHLGFLASPADDGVVAIVAEALSGELTVERRANMRIDVVLDGQVDPFEADCSAECEEIASFFAFNEVAITRGTMGRIIDFSLDISEANIASMRGDGLVVATATGSTAYALSAGGPLVAPSFMGLIVVPLAPHTIQSRAILTGENDVVRIDLEDNYATREATLFLDGELLPFDAPIRRIYVRRGEKPTSVLRYSGENFYEHAAQVFFRSASVLQND